MSVSAFGDKIHSEASQPMSTLVVFTRDRREAGLPMSAGSSHQAWDARVFGRQACSDPFEHPSPREVQTVQVHEVTICPVCNDGSRQPVGQSIRTQFGQKIVQPSSEFGGLQ